MSKVIAISNQKGGVGKTTTAVNLATGLVKKNKKVLMIDVDPQGNATSGLGIDKREVKSSVYNLLIDDTPIQDIILPGPLKNLDVCSSNIQLAGAEVELVSMMSRETRLKFQIDKVKDLYDFVLIDCPPSLGLLTINSLSGADSILVPIQCEYYALEGLSQLMDTIHLVQRHLNPSLEIEGVVLTMFDNRTNLSNQVLEEVKKYFGNRVFKSVIPRNVRISEAPSFGLPVVLYDPKSKGAEAYMNLTKEVIAQNRKEKSKNEKGTR